MRLLWTLALLLCWAGCSAWPRYANLPDPALDAVPVGTDPSDAVDFNWSQLGRETDPGNDTPPAPQTLDLEEGWVLFGSLSGVGWDATAIPDRTVSCEGEEAESDFPPLSQGNYTGDLDWMAFSIAADGLFCAVVEMELPEDTKDFAYDFLAYDLDDCYNPRTARTGENGSELGLGQYGAEADWQTEVVQGDALGVLLAGFVPNETLDLTLTWRAGVALIPSVEAGGTGLCPSLPE